MTGREQTEIERKYDVEDRTPVPSLRGVDGIAAELAEEPVTLTAVYYDTTEHALARRRVVLRRREGGGDAGWHLKMPADEGRTEVHWSLNLDTKDDSGQDPIPHDVLEPVRAIVRDRPLTPLAGINTVRTTVRLTDADGNALAEISDDLVSASDARSGTHRTWREWEVELLDGAPDTREKRTGLLDAIEQALLAAGATPATSVAKIARAVGVDSLTALESTDTAPGPPAAPAPQDPASAGSVVVGALHDLTESLIDHDPGARADAPDAIHQMRTVVRRLRSVLAVYSRLFEASTVKSLRGELKQLGVELGRARDAEVHGGKVADELADAGEYRTDDAEVRLVGGAHRDHAAGVAAVRAYLASPRYYRLLDDLEAFSARPTLTPHAGHPAAGEVKRDLGKAVGVLAKRAAAVTGADAPEVALHEVRKAARRLRYAADAVAAVPATKHRRRYARIGAVAKPLVKRLGDRHDRLLYLEQLTRAGQAAHESGENTLVYGLLVARSERRDDTVQGVLGDIDSTVRRLERLVRAL